MLKITPDTNVLVSATIVEGKQYQILKLAKLGKIKLILSAEIIEEFKEVISREKFGFSDEQINEAIKQILDIAEIVVPRIKIDAVKEDPDDNKVLECAFEGGVDYIISGDEHLLKLGSYRNIKIVNASRFFELERF